MGRSLLGAISAASVVLAAASFKAVLDDPPKEGDPPAWIFYASSVAAAGLAALAVAFALRGRRALSLARCSRPSRSLSGSGRWQHYSEVRGG